MLKIIPVITVIVLSIAPASNAAVAPSYSHLYRSFNAEFEYYSPKDDDRQIESAFIYALWGKEYVNELHYSLYCGAVGTYAWGYILQWDENFNDVRYNTEAAGAGPAVLIRVDFFRSPAFHLSGDFLMGAIFYNKNFPPGGDIYNFFRKYGISMGLALDHHREIVLGFRDMHVSNGQGMNSHNPSYEGYGISLDFVKHL
jgi:lipid A 3-O-deacylase